MKFMIKKLIFCLLLINSTFLGISQTVIITHGYSMYGTTDPVSTWMTDMANSIVSRVGGGEIRVYNPQSGDFDIFSGSGLPKILLFGWKDETNEPGHGFSEDAGAALFTSLMKGMLQGDFNLNSMHFIGHSRGSVVNSEAVERLLTNGFSVEQVTYLDPDDGGLYVAYSDQDCNPDSIASGIEGWNGIIWADDYWQNKLFFAYGRVVEGTFPEYLGTIGHQEVHNWYATTIADTSIHDGFYFSLLGGGSSFRNPVTGLQRNPFFNPYSDGIVNGNLEKGNWQIVSVPGWYYHGGSGNAIKDSTFLLLDSTRTNRTHDRFYVPPDAAQIAFDYKILKPDSSGLIPNTDKLQVIINGTVVLDNIYMDSTMHVWKHLSFDITPYQNSVQTIKFQLVDENGGTTNLNSAVWLDNIQMVEATVHIYDIRIEKPVVKAFPNPASSEINFIFENSINPVTKITIYDIVGKEVFMENKPIQAEVKSYKMNVSFLNPGLYLYKINNEDIISVGKLVITSTR